MADGVDLASPDGKDGTWDWVLAKLTVAADAAGLVGWSLSVHSTIARARQYATNTTRQGAGSNSTNPEL